MFLSTGQYEITSKNDRKAPKLHERSTKASEVGI